ncbi:uncharacterized protein LOC111086960 [Limulus polyphemus]|uniref:Uncharacterized protein LOC111086960 n=1 Tax=Limulus polyphemus TaxID=6850 RepID=A0ABM1SVE8_LIMPO|nr:uncharacterized protein LOC111086960 [Limulus polyphemus]
MDDEHMIVGEPTRKAMQKVSSSGKHKMLLGMRAFYSSAITYLINHLPVSESILKYVGCLNPMKTGTVHSIKRLAKKLPNVSETDIVEVLDEWNLYLAEKASMQDHSENEGEACINHYWRDVLAQIRID